MSCCCGRTNDVSNFLTLIITGETALHKAARKSYFAIYNLLVIDGHADEMTKSISHQTPSAILKDDMN